MNWNTNQIIVTGGGGWLGGTLLRALLNGIEDCGQLRTPPEGLEIRVIAMTDQDAARLNEWPGNVTVIRGDLLDADCCDRLCQGASGALLFHLAGIIHARRTRDLFAVNLDATKNIMAAASRHGIKRAVAMSSNSPLGCSRDPVEVFDEKSPYNPYMKYGRSKMLMEMHLKEVQAAGDVETVTIRCPWFYGPYQPPRQTLFFEMIRDGKAPIVGSGENRRSMGYLENVAQGLILAALVPQAAGQTYWIADERAYSMNEIIDTVERLMESEFDIPCKHSRLRLPGVASEIARLADWSIQAIGWYNQKVHVLSEMNKTIACSVEKAKTELGYVPHIALEEGMRRSLRWCVDQGLLGNGTS